MNPSHDFRLLMVLSGLWALPGVAQTDAAARDRLVLESRSDGKCQNLSEGGKLVVLKSLDGERAITYKLVRYFADVPQSTPVGRISPDTPEQPLGCNRVDGRPQRWEIRNASFEERDKP